MRSSYLNAILIALIIMVLGTLGFFGWKALYTESPVKSGMAEKFVPPVVVNRGKVSEERDAGLEADVRKISDAAQSYAKSHKGIYPESDIQNPCTGTSYCLKSVDINTIKEIVLNPIPQIEPRGIDYYYRADNKAKTYCVKTPVVLETANTMLFQCSQTECKRVVISDSCVK